VSGCRNTTGTRHDALIEYLTAVRDMVRDHTSVGHRPHAVYVNTEDIVLRHGRPYDGRPLPDGYEPGEKKRCFSNALETMVDDFDLTYVEGFAISDGGLIAVHHAWCVDEDGNVVDTTWPKPGGTYFGVPLDRDYVTAVVLAKGSDTVFDWMRGEELYDRPLPDEALAEIERG
jgi:hypothetical protein